MNKEKGLEHGPRLPWKADREARAGAWNRKRELAEERDADAPPKNHLPMRVFHLGKKRPARSL